MMKLIEKKFERVCAKSGWDGVKIGGYICSTAMKKCFSIPGHCREIWVSLHNTPSPYRLAMVVVDVCGGMMDLVEVVGANERGNSYEWGSGSDRKGNPYEWGSDDLDSFLKKYIGKKLYVQVEFMG